MTGTPIHVVGISHKTAPLSRREPFAFPPSTCREILKNCAGEAFILVTCNRTELYGTDDPARLKDRLFEASGGAEETLYRLTGEEAVRHLFSVASGLDSMVLGEPQILGQVKRAMRVARNEAALGPVLDELTRRALHVGRRVRAETDVGKGMPSIPKVATGMARLTLGDLAGATMLVVGTGKLGDLTAQTLKRAGATRIAVTNRNPEPAERLAAIVGGRAEPFERLEELLGDADIVITCTASRDPILRRDMIERATKGRLRRPLVVIDIAVPRDVEPSAREIEGIRLVDLDDLRGWSSEAVAPESLETARSVVEREVDAFDLWLAGRTAVPMIRALRDRAEAILDFEVDRASPEERERLRLFGWRVVNKLLHHPVARLRTRAATEGDEYLSLASDLFALDVEFPEERDGNSGDE